MSKLGEIQKALEAAAAYVSECNPDIRQVGGDELNETVQQVRAGLVDRVGGDCCNGSDPACAGGCLFAEAVRRSRPNDAATIRAIAERWADTVFHYRGPTNMGVTLLLIADAMEGREP